MTTQRHTHSNPGNEAAAEETVEALFCRTPITQVTSQDEEDGDFLLNTPGSPHPQEHFSLDDERQHRFCFDKALNDRLHLPDFNDVPKTSGHHHAVTHHHTVSSDLPRLRLRTSTTSLKRRIPSFLLRQRRSQQDSHTAATIVDSNYFGFGGLVLY